MEPTIGILPTASLYDQRELNDLRSHYVASTPERQILRSKKAEDVVVDYSRDAAGLIRPNIQFQPSLEDYLERSQQVRMAGLPATDLPRGFPQEIIGSRVWSGQDGTSVEQFIVQLSSQDIIEIESAVAGFKCESHKFLRTYSEDLLKLLSQLFRVTMGQSTCPRISSLYQRWEPS